MKFDRKKIGYIVAAVLLIGVGAWIGSRWRVWFGNVAEMDFAITTVPDRITLTTGTDFMTERNVQWRCGNTVDSTARLELTDGRDTTTWKAQGTIIEARGAKDAYYTARIVNLMPGTTYRYRVTTGDRTSRWFTLRMPEDGVNERSFLYFGDVQDTIGGTSGAMFAKMWRNYGKVDFWACCGDLIERPINKYWNYLYESTDSVLAMMPLMATAGNHEYVKGFRPHVDERWSRTFIYGDNGAKRSKETSYFVDMPNLRLIVLDSHGINTMMTAVSEYQWLRDVLRGAEGKWKVVMMHHPLYSVRKGRNNYTVRNTFGPLMEKYGVHLVLTGHEHGFGRMVADAGVAAGDHPVYIVSSASHKTYPTKEEDGKMKIVEGRRVCELVSYNDQTMTVKTVDLDNDSVIDITRIKK